jgi:O-antigen/teichoic acid export membrane protein
MSREKELAKNTFIIALGTFLPKLTTLVTLPILTAYLTKAEYGTFDLLSTLVSVVLPVATLRVETAAFRFLIDCRDSKEKTASIVSTILTFLVPFSVAVIILLFFVMPLDSVFTRGLVSLYFFFDILYLGIQQIIRGLSKNAIYSFSAILYSVINMGLIVALVAGINKGLDGLLASMCIAQFTAILVLIVPTRLYRYYSFRSFSGSLLKEMLGYSWPMIPNALAMWVMNLSDRLIITAVMGVEANAVYAVANKIPNLFTTLQGTYIFAWQENASLSVGDKDSGDYYSKVFDTTFSLLVGMMTVLIAATPIIFAVLIRGDYQEAYFQMPILFGGMLFSAIASFMGGIYVAHKKTKSVGITTMVSAAMNFIINFTMIRAIGLYAGAISTLVSFMFLAFFRMYNVRKFQPMKYKCAKIMLCFAVIGGMCVLNYMNALLTNIINFIVGIVFAVVLNRRFVKSVLQAMVKKIKGKRNNKTE